MRFASEDGVGSDEDDARDEDEEARRDACRKEFLLRMEVERRNSPGEEKTREKMQPSLQGEGNHAILRTDPCDRDERGHRGCVCGRKKKRGALDGGKKRWNGGGHRTRKSSRRRGHAKREQVRPNSIPTESRPVHVKAEHIARIRTSKARMGESKGSIQREICSCEGRAKPCFSWCDLVDKPHATVLGLRSATWRRVSREELSCFLRFTDEVGGSGLV